jgi:Lectin C-type domain
LARRYHPTVRFALITLLFACSFEQRVETGAGSEDADPTSEPAVTEDAAPDDRALAACPTPPAGCTLLTAACLPATSCYFQCTTNRNWEDARVRCVDDGLGCLVTLDSAEENVCLASTLSAAQNRYWIGYRQTNGSVEPGGNWAWTCAPSTFTPSPPWGLPGMFNEPNDFGGNEDCALVVNNPGHWNDAGCGDGNDYVCEFPR